MSSNIDTLTILFLGILGVFLILYFCITLYLFYRKTKIKIQKTILKRFMKKEGILYVSSYHENFLLRKLRSTDYFINFVEVTEESEINKRKNYLRNLKSVFEKLVSLYQKKKTSFQVYFVSFLQKYPTIYEDNWNDIIKYLIHCCESPSLYLRENALKAISKIGKEDYLEDAFHKMNKKKINHPVKLLTDTLLQFEGNIDNLIEMLRNNMNTYEENYKIACIEYFSYQKIDIKNMIFELLSSKEETKEVKLACIRYFANSIYEPVTKALYALLKEDTTNYEYAAVAANVLKSYPSKETLKHLTNALRSPNWFVRNNAAASIVGFANESDLESIRKIDDNYGREAINYQIARQKKEVKES